MAWAEYNISDFVPEIKHGHSATSVGNNIVVFGGWEGNKPTNEVFILKNFVTEV